MRKVQEKLIEKAKKNNLTEAQIAMLSREDLTITELDTIMTYFLYNSKRIAADALVKEAETCVTYLINHKEQVTNAYDYKILFKTFLSSSYDGKDELINDKRKFRIFKVYRFLLRHKAPEEKCIDFCFFYSYVYMLTNHFPTHDMNILLRPILQNKELSTYYGYLLHYKYPCLQDDYLHNRETSLLYYLVADRKILQKFCPAKKILDDLYDWEQHKFRFGLHEFDNYFVLESTEPHMDYRESKYRENTNYINKLELKKYPIVSEVADFCKEYELTPYRKNNDTFNTWQMFALENPDEISRVQEAYQLLGRSFTTNIKATYFSIEINRGYFITVHYNEYRSIYVGAKNENKWCPCGVPKKSAFFIFPDGKLYKKSPKTGKYYPLPIRDFLYLYNQLNICGKFMGFLLDWHTKKNIFYKDVMKDMLETAPCIPLSFNEIELYHNRAELIHEKYKTSAGLNIKWNKQNLNLSYLIIKAYPLVESGISRRILLQQRAIELVNEIDRFTNRKKMPYEFIWRVLRKNIMNAEAKRFTDEKIAQIKEKYRNELMEELQTDVLSDEYEQWISEKVEEELSVEDINYTLSDYISMCRQSKTKIRLDIRSTNQLYNLHNRISSNRRNYRKMTGVVKIPKDSTFLPLREILPPEFEWITTRKRLILETELQHHCVWSYAESITDDKCAIYSFTDTSAEHTVDGVPKRYTVEFRQRGGAYYVEQVQGKYDRVNAGQMKEYIQSLLETYITSKENEAIPA